MDLNKAIKKRTSIRKYLSEKPPIEQVIECIEAANHAPSPGNLQILKYIIIEDREKIIRIAEACDQEFIQEASIVIIVCSDKKNVERMYEDYHNYIKYHTGAAIENFLLRATDLELASCWVGTFSKVILKDILRIPVNIEIEAILPIGYGPKKKQEPKPHLDTRIFFERWNNRYRKPIVKIRENFV